MVYFQAHTTVLASHSARRSNKPPNAGLVSEQADRGARV